MSVSALAQDACKAIPQGATVPESTGCVPLVYKPADGGPVQTVWTPAVFLQPQVQSGNTQTVFTATKYRTLDIGGSAYFVNPDYGHGSNVNVGAFVAYTGRFFGVEADAADTIRNTGGIHEPYIVAGPRIQYRTRHFVVYGKAQVGAGHFSGDNTQPQNNKHTFLVENYGAGLEFIVSRHLKVRVVDANYQIWPSFSPNKLTPFHVGSGLAYSF